MAQLILVLLPTSILGLLAIALCLPRSALAGEIAPKVTTSASYATASVPVLAGFTADEWQAIGVIGGLVLGALTWIGNMVVTWYFKRQHVEIAREMAREGRLPQESD